MGLFSTKYKIHPATVVSPLIPYYENPIPALIVGAVLGNDNIADSFTTFRTNSLFSKAGAFFRYGRDHYIRGLPTGSLRNTNINKKGIIDLIETETSHEIELLRVLYDNSFEDHYVAMHLQDTREMDYYTKAIGVNPGVVTGDLHYTGHAYDPEVAQISIEYTASDNITISTEVIAFPYPDNKAYQVLYRILGDAGVGVAPIYWMYIEETIVEGDSVLFPDDDLIPVSGNYFPVVPFFEDKEEFVTEAKTGTPLYTTSKRLLKKLGLSYEDMGASLREGTVDSIGKGKGMYCYFQIAVGVTGGARMVTGESVPVDGSPIPLNEYEIPVVVATTKRYQPTLAYLTEFFKVEQGNSKHSKTAFKRACIGTDTYKFGPELNTIIIEDGNFNYSLSYYYIEFSVKTGVLTDGVLNVYTSEVHEKLTQVPTILGTIKINTSTLFIRKQITSTTYSEVEVCGLKQEIKVFKDKSVITYLDHAFDGEPFYITIPVNYDVFSDMAMPDRDALFSASMCLVFNSYTTQEIKWYAQGLFKAILTIISIVLSPFTGGTSLTLLLLLRYIVLMLIMNLVLKYFIAPIFRHIAKELGVGAASILAVVLAIIGAITGNPKAAQLLLNLSRFVFAGIDAQLRMEMEDLQKDYAKLESETDALNAELKRAEGLLDRDMIIDPMSMVNAPSSVVWGESAEAFIVSRLQVPSLNLALIQMPAIYTELMLTLPSVNETLNIR